MLPIATTIKVLASGYALLRQENEQWDYKLESLIVNNLSVFYTFLFSLYYLCYIRQLLKIALQVICEFLLEKISAENVNVAIKRVKNNALALSSYSNIDEVKPCKSFKERPSIISKRGIFRSCL